MPDDRPKRRSELKSNTIFAVTLVLTTHSASVRAAAAEVVAASDPTKIYSYVSPGFQFTEYSNGDSLSEVRAIGNIGISDQDMLLFEIGYGG